MLRTSFVTGGTGLLGSALIDKLIARGDQVVCLVRDQLPNSRLSLEKDKFKNLIVVQGDILNKDLIRRILYEYEVNSVFHLAAQTLVGVANRDPVSTLKVNVEGSWNILDEFRLYSLACPQRQKALIVASSDKAYGDLHGSAYTESYPLKGDHPYDVSKSCCDLISQAYAKTYGLNLGITRCGNFFGPGDLNGSRLVPGTILSVLRGEAPVIRSDGTLIRDYIYVEDGADAYITLEESKYQEKQRNCLAYNFSYGERRSALDVVNSILRLMESNLKPVILNDAIHEIPVQHLDSTLAREELQWRPKYGFEEGLDRTIRWYKENHKLMRIATK